VTDIAAGYERYLTLAKKRSEWFQARPPERYFLVAHAFGGAYAFFQEPNIGNLGYVCRSG
jgi:hypothetical protein